MVAHAQEAERCIEEGIVQKLYGALDMVGSAASCNESSENVKNGFLFVSGSFSL